MLKAILTGHTRGLGAAIAEELLSRDIAILAIARHRNTDLGKRFSGRLQQVELDLADSAALSRWLSTDEMRDFLSPSDTALLINNAGMLQPMGPADTLDAEAIGRAIALNVAAPLMLSSAMIAATTHLPDRRILHVSSGAGRDAYPSWSMYCASKAALDHHARSVALEALPALRICSLAPGVIDTDMQAEIRASTVETFPLREKFVALKDQHQLARPRDAAAGLLDYLLNPGFGRSAVADLRSLPSQEVS